MKVLYAALRHDPRDPDAASGVDHNFYHAMTREGLEVRIVGPFPGPFPWYEHAVRRMVSGISKKRFLKWDVTSMLQAALAVNRLAAEWKPDVVFSIFPPPLMLYRGRAPCVFNTDITFRGMHEGGAPFDPVSLFLLEWIERRAVRRSDSILVFSEWGKREIIRSHGTDPAKIEVMPMPSALPDEAVPATLSPGEIRNGKALGDAPLRLLLVGRDFHRKGVDVAIEIVRLLNAQGVAAELTVCATQGPSAPHVRYVGPFRKRVPEELAAYAALYREAHLLLHPARFEAAGIVPGEAAAFGTPTITNDIQGLATTVKDGESGVVLPSGSPPEAYAAAIEALVKDPARYEALCRSTRARYERELNWKVAGRRVVALFDQLVSQRAAGA